MSAVGFRMSIRILWQSNDTSLFNSKDLFWYSDQLEKCKCCLIPQLVFSFFLFSFILALSSSQFQMLQAERDRCVWAFRSSSGTKTVWKIHFTFQRSHLTWCSLRGAEFLSCISCPHPVWNQICLFVSHCITVWLSLPSSLPPSPLPIVYLLPPAFSPLSGCTSSSPLLL